MKGEYIHLFKEFETTSLNRISTNYCVVSFQILITETLIFVGLYFYYSLKSRLGITKIKFINNYKPLISIILISSINCD
jgi:hypothetical protein